MQSCQSQLLTHISDDLPWPVVCATAIANPQLLKSKNITLGEPAEIGYAVVGTRKGDNFFLDVCIPRRFKSSLTTDTTRH